MTVTHADTVEQLTRFGAEVERVVFATRCPVASRDRVLRHENATVVF